MPHEPESEATQAIQGNGSGQASLELTTADINGLNRSVFEWADSSDRKDWDRLARNLAPTLRVEYSGIGQQDWPAMPAADYVALAKNPAVLGNARLDTQHLIGATHYTLTAPDEAEGRHQIRAAHQLWTDASKTEVKLRGHAHTSSTHWYRKIDGVWKLAGLKPIIMWSEGDFEGIWKG